MKRLSKEKRKEIENLLVHGYRKKTNGYISLVIERKGNIKRIKRGRAYFQLVFGLELTPHEIIHHVDGNKENDSPSNLEMIDTTNFDYHTSKHHAGKRKNG